MKAKYQLVRTSDFKKSNEEQPFHARLVPHGTVSITEMMEYAREYSTFSTSDIKGALELISQLVEQGLREGHNVLIDGIGYLSVSLECRPVMDKREIRSPSVRFRQVNFRLDKKMKRSLRNMPLERMPEKDKRKFSHEQRLQRLWAYLERHSIISRRQYMGLNQCTKYQALKDLNEQITAGNLETTGERNSRLYKKP